MNTGEPQRSCSESQRAMNSQSDSRSRFWPKYSLGSCFSSPPCCDAFCLSGCSLSFPGSMIRLLPGLLFFFPGREAPCEAGAEGVNKQEMGNREPRRLVLDELWRKRGERPV